MYLSISGDRKIYYVTIYGTGSIQIPQCMARHPGRPQATVVKNEKLYESYHRIYCDGVKPKTILPGVLDTVICTYITMGKQRE